MLGQTILGSWFLSFRASFRLGDIQNKGGASIVVTDPPQPTKCVPNSLQQQQGPPFIQEFCEVHETGATSPNRGYILYRAYNKESNQRAWGY